MADDSLYVMVERTEYQRLLTADRGRADAEARLRAEQYRASALEQAHRAALTVAAWGGGRRTPTREE